MSLGRESTRPSLLARLRDWEDDDAWAEFDAKYRPLILRYCSRQGLQASDAEDVRQAVLINLIRGIGKFEYSPSRGRFRDYLGRMVKNSVYRHFRGQTPGPSRLENEDRASMLETDQSHLWEQEWIHHHYRLAMETVRKNSEPKSIEVFERLLAGSNPDEVASLFGLERTTVYKIKQRVRDRLQDCVRRQIADEQLPPQRKSPLRKP